MTDQPTPNLRSRSINPASERSSHAVVLIAALLLVFGLGLRLFDITDQPIDFHPTRQLRGAIIARGIYYDMLPPGEPSSPAAFQRQQAIDFWYSTGQYEPSILETISAYTYLALGAEQIWVPRAYSALFWVLAGLPLLDLARRLAPGRRVLGGPALLALGYYLALPFAVQASRTIQPDPMMVMWIVFAAWALFRWSESFSWKWALLAGVLGGLALLTKVVAAYPLAGAAIGLVVAGSGWKRFWRSPQVWAMAVLMLLPTVLYYLNRGGRASEFFSSWTVALSDLLLQPSLYARWFNLVQSLLGLTALLLALSGVLIAAGKGRALLLGLWVGYAAYGLFLPYQMYTHNYYHLMLVPITALSLTPIFSTIWERVQQQAFAWRMGFAALALVGLAYLFWVSVAELQRESFQSEPAYWQEIAAKLPADGKIVALTQDYGYRFMYYGWRKVTLWPIVGERELARLRGNNKEFQDFFNNRVEGKRYFLITAFNQYEKQPDLVETLEQGYTLVSKGTGYEIYDLEQPLQ